MSTLFSPTLAYLRGRVRFYIDEPVQANFSNANINASINEAQQQIVSEIIQVDEEYFVNGTPTTIQMDGTSERYPLATDFYKMVRLEYQNTGQRIPFFTFREKNSYGENIVPFSNIGAFGTMTQAYILGNTVGFNPLQTDPTVVVQYWYAPIAQDMVNDTDITVIPRMWTELMALQAAMDCLINDESDISQLLQKYNIQMTRMKSMARQRQQQNPKHVIRTNYGDNPFIPI